MPNTNKQPERKIYTCRKCGHIWLPRATTGVPRLCPSCKSVRYDEPKKT